MGCDVIKRPYSDRQCTFSARSNPLGIVFKPHPNHLDWGTQIAGFKVMKQTDLGLDLSNRRTRKQVLLSEMYEVMPWSDLLALITLFTLSNIWMARRSLMQEAQGWVRPQTANKPQKA
jgi:hypothetical protein